MEESSSYQTESMNKEASFFEETNQDGQIKKGRGGQVGSLQQQTKSDPRVNEEL